MNAQTIIDVPRDIHYYVGTTPTLILPPAISSQGIVKTVRGGAGIHTDFSQDQVPTKTWQYLHLFGDVNDARIKTGKLDPQTFAAGAVTPATDLIDITAHNYLTGDGPFHVSSTTDVPAGLNVAAVGILTLGANAANTNTVTIDVKVYTFQTVLTDVDGNVLIGATASDSIDNLIAAITLGAGAGTTYATSMTLHPTVTAAVGAGDTMGATAKSEGSGANSIATTETLVTGSWADVTLLGGTDGEVFISKVDDDSFKLASSRPNALAGTAIDITDAGVGTHTLDGTYNMVAAPAASVVDGSGGLLLKAGLEIIMPAPRLFTIVGMDAATVVSYFWSK